LIERIQKQQQNRKLIALAITGRYMALPFPHRENFLAKEERLVVSGAACPGCRRGLPPGVTVFANATIFKSTS
jgi:hypothetical protein